MISANKPTTDFFSSSAINQDFILYFISSFIVSFLFIMCSYLLTSSTKMNFIETGSYDPINKFRR